MSLLVLKTRIIPFRIHYLKSTGKVPSWVRRVHIFLDNAGSTNKNQFLVGSVFEIVERGVLDYFRASFMIAGHTKFAPDRLFAVAAKSYYSLDVFNEQQIISAYQLHASVTFDLGGIVRCWRDVVGAKYTNLPGIRSPFFSSQKSKYECCYEGS